MGNINVTFRAHKNPLGKKLRLPVIGAMGKQFFSEIKLSIPHDPSVRDWTEESNRLLKSLDLPEGVRLTVEDFSKVSESNGVVVFDYECEHFSLTLAIETELESGLLVVTAANRYCYGEDLFVVCGIRHRDRIMRGHINELKRRYPDMNTHECEEGFLTSDGEFVTREEAMAIVLNNGQRYFPERNGCTRELFSEGIH